MKRRAVLTVLLALLMASLVALPAFGEGKVNLKVNGDPVTLFKVVLKDGNSMVSVDAFARFAGAEVNWTSEDTVQIIEEQKTLELTVGSSEALLGNETVSMPYPPVKSGNEVFIPLRFTCEAFGFNVGWDNTERMVLLNRSETRDGMTATDLLVKSSQVTQEVNTYSMDGTIDMKMKFQADGKEVKEAPQNAKVEMTGQIQNDPIKFYIKQKIAPITEDQTTEMLTETYMTAEKMYIKAPGQDQWLVQDMPFSPEFWKEQQDIQSDPIKAAAQMKEMGMLLNYSSDVQIEGKDYYVVNATLDMDKFQEGYQKMIQQVAQSMSLNANSQEMQQQMQQLINNMNIDYYYQAYINKETLITDVIKFDARMDLNVNADTLGMEPKADAPKEISIHYDMQGEFEIYGMSEPFTAPDVSNAQDVKALEEKVNQ